MLIIRPEQMRALEQAQVERFANELVAHIKTFAPIQFKSMGEEAVRNTISIGIKQSRQYGFTLRGPVRFYVEMMFILGSYFDTDPQYHGIIQALFDKNEADEMSRADRLHEALLAYIETVSGKGHDYERLAINRALQAQFDNVVEFADRPSSDLVNVLYKIHPEKVQALGEAAIAALVNKAYAIAEQRGSSWVAARPLFAGLMFTLGHGCFADPQFHWIARTLNNTESTDTITVLKHLYQKFFIFLNQAKSNMEMG